MPEIYTYCNWYYDEETGDRLLTKMFNHDLTRYAGQCVQRPDLFWIQDPTKQIGIQIRVTEEEAIDYLLQRNKYAESVQNQTGGT